MAYDQFSTPSSTALYSEAFFASLTFAQVENILYPHIGLPTLVKEWRFCAETQASGRATLVLPNESVPPISALQPILQSMEQAYADGMRSVMIVYSDPILGPSENFYHFSKIRLFKLVNNHAGHVQSARELLRYIERQTLLPPSLLELFKSSRILAPIEGLWTSCVPLYKLWDFLDENWLEEDILNALSELCYLREHANSGLPGSPPSFLFFPTYFFTEASRLYKSHPKVLSTQLLDIRRRIHNTGVRKVAFIAHSSNHYAAYCQVQPQLVLEHGDSLHRAPSQDVLDILQWVFADLDDVYACPTQIVSGEIAHQGLGTGGEGSCALAALNFIELRLENGTRRWTGSKARYFRDTSLQELLVYHFTASSSPATLGECITECMEVESGLDSQVNSHSNLGFTGYNDYNLLSPLANHPIYNFLQAMSQLTPFNLPRMPATLPLVGNLVTQYIPQKLADVSVCPLLPALEIEAGIHRPSTPISSKKSRSPSLEIISPSRIRPAKRSRAKPLALSPSLLSISDSDIDVKPLRLSKNDKDQGQLTLSKLGLTTKKRATQTPCKKDHSPTVIDLTTPKSHPLDVKIKVEKRADRKLPPNTKSVSKAVSKNDIVRDIKPSQGDIRVGRTFASMEDGFRAVCEQQAELGHTWIISQTYRDSNGHVKKLTTRCNHYRKPQETHKVDIDPSEHRRSKSKRTDCKAHVNVTRVSSSTSWYISTAVLDHNHEREVHEEGTASHRPTTEERDIVSKLATSGRAKFSRSQISVVLANEGHALEPRQITNISNKARRQAKDEVSSHGGNFEAIIADLHAKAAEERGWNHRLKLDDNGTVVCLWWQSPKQFGLTKRFNDILINDNANNRNDAGYSLNIGIIIDNFGKSRNIWYALQAYEDAATHSWVFRCHLEVAGVPPTTLITDRGPGLISSAIRDLPLTDHVYCLFHLDENVTKNLRPRLGSEWPDFQRNFWRVYNAVSPEEFDRLWNELISRFPAAKEYLENELYPCREKWAWAWVSTKFTAGVRTNGRVEIENRVNKEFADPKTSIFQVYVRLNERTQGQAADDMIRVRDVSDKHQPCIAHAIN
ncbi:hypothetical protein CVT26_002883 [Gymnopilus dilepis]|uniref:Uncharacterized protein n=1 Tax=Gymnopilus dilepis TaxID=231916 RepID=A0A409WR94_9AGAR|nr:hypothetical protein CVT26_002883 [Gymnopilus dilepis]